MSDQLWAPWRFNYVQSADNVNRDQCIFCALCSGDDDRNNWVLHRGEHVFVLLNVYPYTSGHLMVAPYRHVGDISDMEDDELFEINKLIQVACEKVRKVFSPDGFNLGVNMGRAAGAGIPKHIHWHVVPRWEGDTNFMTTVGDARVIPQDLQQTWELLKSVW